MIPPFKHIVITLLGVLSTTVLFAANETADLRGNGMLYTENKGQIVDAANNLRPDILFVGDAGTKVFLKRTGISYVLSNVSGVAETDDIAKKFDNAILQTHRVDVEFVGANNNSDIIKSDLVEGYVNYYYAHCPSGIKNVNRYNKILLKGIYNGVDIVYHGGKQNGFKYDWIVKPGGNVSDIRMKFSGENSIEIKDGKLIVGTSLGELGEWMPRVYQEINGKIVDVKAGYEILNGTVSIWTEGYNKDYKLIIDPWVTYYGGSDQEGATSVANDGNGNVLFTGYTSSVNFPVLGPNQGSYTASYDAYVVKMGSNGTLIWASYYGGTLSDCGSGITTDGNNNVCVSGYSYSLNLPMGASGGNTTWQNTYGGGTWDAFVLKLDAAGSLLWSTYYGGSAEDKGKDIATDANNNVILYGTTLSTTSIATPLTFQPALSLLQDAYVVKFGPTGNRIWGTYCGGTKTEDCGGIVCNTGNDIYISGQTDSNNLPTSIGSHQSAPGGGKLDAFLFKFDQNGTRVWATYYGGAAADNSMAIAIDNLGNVMIGGITSSATNISTAGSFQPSLNPIGTGEDAYVVKFNAAGVRQWATYLGGTNGDYVSGLGTDASNNVVVAGDTYSIDFPTTTCAYQSSFIGTEDQFITTFNSSGGMICSGYIGVGTSASPNNETAQNEGGSISVYGAFLYLSVYTQCSYPVTANAYQSVCGGGFYDGAIAQLCITSCGITTPAIDFAANDTTVCLGTPVNFVLQNNSCDTTNTFYQWTFNGAATSTSTDRNPSGIMYPQQGTYNVKVKIVTPCGIDSLEKVAYISVTGFTVSINSIVPANCGQANGSAAAIVNGASGAVNYIWSTAPPQNTSSATGLAAGNYSVNVTDANGCSQNAMAIIPNNSPFNVQLTGNAPATCFGSCNGNAVVTANLGTQPYSYTWSTLPVQNNATATALCAGIYSATVSESGGCIATLTVNITEPPFLTATVSPASSICAGQNISISVGASGGNGVYNYTWSGGQNIQTITVNPLLQTIYTATTSDANGCSAIASTTITVNPLPVISFSADDTVGCEPLCISLTNATPGTASAAWTFGDGASSLINNPNHCYNTSGSYNVSLTVTDGNGCSSSLTKNNYITVHPKPTAAFTTNPTNVSSSNGLVVFTDQSTNASSWVWSFGDQLFSNSTLQNTQFTYSTIGVYSAQLIVTNQFGCSDTADTEITVEPEYEIFYPNTFTPNGDNVNDFFMPNGVGIAEEDFEMMIFDRWGNQIYYANSVNKPWNGHANNGSAIAQEDTYVWKMNCKDLSGNKHSYLGNVNLIR